MKLLSSEIDLKKFSRALVFASNAHRNQRRKDSRKSPYINHPISVANRLIQANVFDSDTLIAALLHDTIEDTEVLPFNIISAFGQNVAYIVLECSDDKTLPKEMRKQLQIEHAAHVSTAAKLVKIADKLDNLEGLLTAPPVGWSQEEINGYVYWCYAVYQQLKGVNDVLMNSLKNYLANLILLLKEKKIWLKNWPIITVILRTRSNCLF